MKVTNIHLGSDSYIAIYVISLNVETHIENLYISSLASVLV